MEQPTSRVTSEDKTNEKLSAILRNLAEARRLDADTASVLEEDGEKIRRMDGALNNVKNNQQVASTLLSRFEAFWPTSLNPFYYISRRQANEPVKKSEADFDLGDSDDFELVEAEDSSFLDVRLQSSGRPVRQHLLQAITRETAEIGHQARGINDCLDEQNEALQAINDRFDSAQTRAMKLNRRIDRL